MKDRKEDNEIISAVPEEPTKEHVIGQDSFLVSMDAERVFPPEELAPGDLPAAEISADLAPLLERAFLFLEDSEWDKANDYCERVLDKAPRTPLAYLGKFMAEKHVKTREDLPDVPIDLEGDRNYSKAVRFADPELADVLTRYAQTGRSAKRQRRIRRAVTAVLLTAAILFISTGIAAAVWFGKLLPQRTFDAETEALEKAVIGDTVTFGSFRCPTEWLVLSKQGDEVLLLSRHAVGTSRYNDASVDTTWAKSDIRRWLNGDFYEKSFGEQEKALIKTTEIDAYSGLYGGSAPEGFSYDEDGVIYDDDGGTDYLSYTREESGSVTDRLFLLNLAELNLHMKTETEKRCLAQPDPKAAKTAGESAPAEYTSWWLRTQTGEGLPACYIDETGATQYDYYGEDPALGVRPAVWIDLGSRQ